MSATEQLNPIAHFQTIFSEDALSLGDGNRQVFVPTGFYKVSVLTLLERHKEPHFTLVSTERYPIEQYGNSMFHLL